MYFSIIIEAGPCQSIIVIHVYIPAVTTDRVQCARASPGLTVTLASIMCSSESSTMSLSSFEL